MDTLLSALGLFDLTAIMLLLVGLLVGFAAGAIPGLAASTVVALFLPLSIAIDPSAALIFMAAVYCGAQYGAAPPAILLNFPGDLGGAVTALDGYPMTRRGEGLRALGISRIASGVAGVVAASIVIIVFQPLSGVLLFVGPPEAFVISVVGLTVISVVSGKHVVRAFFCAALGVLLSLMSADPIYGGPRMSFGIPELYDSFPFVPTLVGLFGISELARLMRRSRVNSSHLQRMTLREQVRQVGDGFKDTLGRPFATLRGSLIGLAIGILPGVGGATSNFISYTAAKRLSKDPDSFGKGNPEGIIASETADNGVTAGAMVPTFAFGIPGSATSAVYAVMLAIIFASILTIPLGTVLGSLILKVATLPANYLVPLVLVLATMGVYSFRRSAFDVVLLALFGAIGYILRKYDFPIVALVMGIILGPIMEGNFNRAILIGGGDLAVFVRGPVTWVLWAIVVAAIVAIPLFARIKRKQQAATAATR